MNKLSKLAVIDFFHLATIILLQNATGISSTHSV